METNPAPNSNTPPAAVSAANAILLDGFRHSLTLIAGALVTHGWLNSNTSEWGISAVLFLAALGWSILERSQYAARLNAALEAAAPLVQAALPFAEAELTEALGKLPDASGQGSSLSNSLPNPNARAEGAHDAGRGVGGNGAPPTPGIRSDLLFILLHSWGAVLCLCLTSCAFVQKPSTQAALTSVLNGAVAYATGNDVGAAVDGISAASLLVRSLQSTPQAANPPAVQAAVTSGGAAPIAPQVSSAITSLVQAGQAADSANELVAEQLDAAVVQVTAPQSAALRNRFRRGLITRATFQRRVFASAHAKLIAKGLAAIRSDLAHRKITIADARFALSQIADARATYLLACRERFFLPPHIQAIFDPVRFDPSPIPRPPFSLRFRNPFPDPAAEEERPVKLYFAKGPFLSRSRACGTSHSTEPATR